MANKIVTENGPITNFEGLMTLTLNQVILHTIVHHSLTSTYVPSFIEIEEIFCGRTDIHARTHTRTYKQTDRQTFETGFIRSTLLKS